MVDADEQFQIMIIIIMEHATKYDDNDETLRRCGRGKNWKNA